jgi:hypothetical protein
MIEFLKLMFLYLIPVIISSRGHKSDEKVATENLQIRFTNLVS